MANVVKIRIETENNSKAGLKKAEDGVKDVDKALNKTEKQAKQAEQAVSNIKKAGPALDKVKADAKKLGAELDDVGEAGADAAKEIGGSFDKLDLGKAAGGLTKGLAGVGLAAGALFAGALSEGIGTALDKNRNQLATSLRTGLTIDEVRRAGEISGELYRSGFGESLEQLNADVADIIDALGDQASGGISNKEIARRSQALSQGFGVDVRTQIELTRSLIKNGLSPDVAAAFDAIATGFQRADGQGDEFADLLLEYGPIFDRVGLNALQAGGFIEKALEGGTFQADKAIDAVKELMIRLKDGTAADAVEKLGLNYEELVNLIDQDRGLEAVKLLTTAIGEEASATERAAREAEVFGTTAEDSITAAMIQQLLDYAAATSGVATSTEVAADESEKAVSKWGNLGRSVSGVASAMASVIVGVGEIPRVSAVLGGLTKALDLATEGFLAAADVLNGTQVTKSVGSAGRKALPDNFTVQPLSNLAPFPQPPVRSFGGGGGGGGGGGQQRAAGGSAGAGLQLVGEGGPELVRLPGGASVMPASNTASALGRGGGGGTTVVINVAGSIRSDGELVRLVKDELDRTNTLAGLGR